MDVRKIIFPFRGKNQEVDIEITYQGAVWQVKARYGGTELRFIPTLNDGLMVLPENHCLEKDLVNEMVWAVLKAI